MATIRKARADDWDPVLARMIWDEDPPVLAAEFGCFDSWVSHLAREWSRPGAVNSFDSFWLAQDDGYTDGPVGFLAGFAARDYAARAKVSDTLKDPGGANVDAVFAEPDPASWYVMDISVIPSLRGRGIGRALMEEAQRAAQAAGSQVLTLDVAEAIPAVQFYQRLGFVIIKRSQDAHLYRFHGVGPHLHMARQLD
ncbi:MAG: GNAT family N-acetyltransferase [Pseudomonadota bacterium]